MTITKPFDIRTTPLEGTLFLEASAGTGKTFSLALIYIRLLLEEEDCDYRSILCVTFTRDATQELKDRIRRFLDCAIYVCESETEETYPEETAHIAEVLDALGYLKQQDKKQYAARRLRHTRQHADEIRVYTIHGFCKRVLTQHAFAAQVAMERERMEDEDDFLRIMVNDFWRRHVAEQPIAIHALCAQQEVKPESLFSIVKKAHTHAMVSNDKPHADVEALLDAWNEVKTQWYAHRDHIETVISDSDAIKRRKNVLKSENMEEFIRQLRNVFDTDMLQNEYIELFSNESIAKLLKKKSGPWRSPFFDAIDRYIAIKKKFPEYLKSKAIEYIQQAAQQEKARKSLYGYSDLLTDVHRALYSSQRAGSAESRLAADLRREFRAVCIDEFQDTDIIQYELFSGAFHGHARMFYIGDPKQAIYRFRGADVFTYKKARSRDDVGRYSLDVNYRSAAALVDAFNAIFDRVRPFVYDWIPYTRITAGVGDAHAMHEQGQKLKQPCIIWRFDEECTNYDEHERKARDALTHEISRLVLRGMQARIHIDTHPLKPGDIAVLVHTNQQAQKVQDHLRATGITSVITKAGSVFHSPEARELLVILYAIEGALRPQAVKGALMTSLLGYTRTDLHALEQDKTRWEEMLDAFRGYANRWERRGVIQAINEMCTDFGVYRRMLHSERGERGVTNIRHLGELLNNHEHLSLCGPYELRVWLQQRIDEGGTESEEYELRLESDRDAVKILTIHRSKGLQFPVVFYPFMCKPVKESKKNNQDGAVFHDPETLRPVFSVDAEHADKEAREQHAESYRKFYVALTRASHCCYASHFTNLSYNKQKVGREDIPERYFFSQIDEMDDPGAHGISVRALPSGVRKGEGEIPKVQTAGKEALRNFTGRPGPSRRIMSFSMLSANDHSGGGIPLRREEDAVVQPTDMALFPRGPQAGTALHDIFNQIDFTDSADWKSTVEHVLDHYRLQDTSGERTEAVFDMLNRIVTAPLGREGAEFSLSQLSKRHRYTELEFFLRSDTVDRQQFRKVLGDHTGSIDIEHAQGLMHGYIDLLFVMNDTYYIIDWKSNYLGPAPSFYTHEAMEEAMRRHNYHLQYYLYTHAVHRYLSCYVTSYDYARDFGGVYYVFMRGVTGQKKDSTGIYYARPDREVIMQLDRMFVS